MNADRIAHSSANRLIREKSPYLLQHAHNPVDWRPWGEEAFQAAREENKPVFLSIGYSTCHWCHVMERESFEDPEVARLMNEVFICIKVDREERPDIDAVYMTVCQMMTGSGGWPLTVFLTPEKKPFFAGTYFPRDSLYGRIGMLELIPRVQDYWRSRREEADRIGDELIEALQKAPSPAGETALGRNNLDSAYEELTGRFDRRNGGFSKVPKFPAPHNLLFLMRYHKRTGHAEALGMVETTLDRMRRGGIFDQIGFGFHRYSTDAQWLVPHFEKMLYDQALLAMAYTEAWQLTRNELYRQSAEEIFEYVLRDMTSPEGGFYSAEDADSEGEEGKFYLWTEREIRDILGPDADLVLFAWNIFEGGNYQEEASGHRTGANIPHLPKTLEQTARMRVMDCEAFRQRLESARKRLFEAREKRVHPQKDDKILTDWNGLTIAALARAGRVFRREDLSGAARRAADFILTRLRTPEGKLLHRYRAGEAALEAHLDDYAFLTWGLIELYEAAFETRYLEAALDMTNRMIEQFWDEAGGGFFLTANDGEPLFARLKQIYDGALPSGNSVVALNLLRLSRMMGNSDFERIAHRIGQAFSEQVHSMPSAHTMLMAAVDFGLGPDMEIVVAGTRGAAETEALLDVLREVYHPGMVRLFRPEGPEAESMIRLAPYLDTLRPIDGKAAAYVCSGFSCKQPVTDPAALAELLKNL